MRALLVFIALGLVALGPVTGQVQARPWRGRAWYGGGRRGFYPHRWGWGRSYAYPFWGWRGYYAYPGYFYPYFNYGYPSYAGSYPLDGLSAPPVSAATTSLYSNPSVGSAPPSPEQTAAGEVLTASGVANDNGRLRWPLGLQVLGGPDTGHQADELRGQLDALFQKAAEQATKGPANPELLQQITRAVNQFRDLLSRDRKERGELPGAIYDEAGRFLNQLEGAEAVLRTGLKTQGAEPR